MRYYINEIIFLIVGEGVVETHFNFEVLLCEENRTLKRVGDYMSSVVILIRMDEINERVN